MDQARVDDAYRRALLARRWAAASAHRDRLLRLARPRVPSEQDAEDCVQEALLRCVEFEHLDEERLGAFLTTVTMRLCADQYRRHAHGDRLRRRLAAWFDDDPGPEDAVCDRAEAAWLADTVATLPARQREIVTARAQGLSCGAVAVSLRLSYTSVESALARARRSVRTALESSLALVAHPARLLAQRMPNEAALAGTAGALAVLNILGGTPAPRPAAETPVVTAPATAPVAVTRPVAPPARAAGPAVRIPPPPVLPRLPSPPDIPDVEVAALGEDWDFKVEGVIEGHFGPEENRRTHEYVLDCVRYGLENRNGYIVCADDPGDTPRH